MEKKTAKEIYKEYYFKKYGTNVDNFVAEWEIEAMEAYKNQFTKVIDDDLEKIAEEKYPRTFYDGTLTLDDKNFEIKRNAFIAGANFKADQSNDDAEMLLWISKMFDLTEGIWYWKDDEDGDNPLTESELLQLFKNRNK